MNTNINREKVLIKALSIMKPKIKKSLISTEVNDREDLEQEIVFRIIKAVKDERIETPPSFSEYIEDFNK
ncbi:hypothetical protein BEH_26015 (plasmid) [Priestia filamentosa]|uniref:Uncharacterized protein n=1 Tax=Priestia filamentosa TaxID=1402861 RepID=A0A2L1FFU9_9BACI|nr:hypothetical protein [Priestia filamentosa]AVD54620.1 hypothetical protein CKF96_03785 [Priestia filamentosa]AWG44816.1 hypothetical protein BEH_26015 [Priestia filamentosa]